MPEDMTLGDFVKQLTVRMEDEKLIMLFKDEAPWHLLFYRLKKAEARVKPAFLSTLRFDWDGPYPRCQELSDYLNSFRHCTGLEALWQQTQVTTELLSKMKFAKSGRKRVRDLIPS
jgi:hypothetical protein